METTEHGDYNSHSLGFKHDGEEHKVQEALKERESQQQSGILESQFMT